MQIGPHTIDPPIGLAPMAGVTDKPFRLLCRRLGAGLATTEMTSANPRLRDSRKSAERLDHIGEPGPISVQIAGTKPDQMAEFARYNVMHGAQIIDINMGCPAKKVCKAWAGSALMQDEAKVAAILSAVVNAVEVPVTLKIRTGWAADQKNAPTIAHIAEDCGIEALAIHGRTRDQKYQGVAEYDTIARIKQERSIPIWANGDVDTPEKARQVLDYTGADGLLIGRAAQGRPWVFREIAHFLQTGNHLPQPDDDEIASILIEHLKSLHEFYGEVRGVRIARKHLGWYVKTQDNGRDFLRIINPIESAAEQISKTQRWFETNQSEYTRAA
ncbi:MAG: tRNA dihydrouridine synthase DusB [Pseudomonadota bacterium]